MQILLETERLILRRFTEADVDHLFELDNDSGVMRFINGGTPTPREVIQNDILPGFLQYDERFPGYGFWAAIEKASGELVGWFSFRAAEGAPDEASLGYRLRKTAWGKGYATEGARALIRKGFTELGVRRVIATTYEDNLASRRVMEKVGMKLVRRFRLSLEALMNADSFHATSLEVWDGDDVEYALERADWSE